MKKLIMVSIFVTLVTFFGALYTHAQAPSIPNMGSGMTEVNSNFSQHSFGAFTNGDSGAIGGVIGSGSVDLGSYAGGFANTNHSFINVPNTFSFGTATHNEALSTAGYSYDIKTNGNWLSMAGAAGTASGDVGQGSMDKSFMMSYTGFAGSSAYQSSNAGFNSADIDVIVGPMKHASSSFDGTSYVEGESWSVSYKTPGVIGTSSGAGNCAQTILDGNGIGYAYGSGSTAGMSTMSTFGGSTAGMYTGNFSYNNLNGWGNVSGYSESYITPIYGTHGAVTGSKSGISVNTMSSQLN